jgi:formiminotetrahydrofolate cyclodeaminase
VSAKHRPQSTALPAVAAALQALSTAVLELADADGSAFEQLLDAYKLPKSTPEEQQARRASIAATAARAAEVGQLIHAHAQRAATLLDTVTAEIHANIVSDFTAAQSLFAANQAIQQKNIEENLAIALRFRS